MHAGACFLLRLCTSASELCTIFFQVLAAEIHYPRHLPVNGVEAELFVLVLLPAAGRLVRPGELESLQQPRLVVIQVGDAIHRHSTLSRQTGDSHMVTTNL